MSDSIRCPKCHAEIPLTDVIRHQVEERVRAEIEGERQRLAEAHAQEIADKEVAHQATLVEREGVHKAEVERVSAELASAAEKKANEKVAIEVRELTSQLEAEATKRRQLEEREQTLLTEQHRLQMEHESLQLQVQRQVADERAKIVADTTARVSEGYDLQLQEKDIRLEEATKRANDLQSALEQKRSGLQGEVLERAIEDTLREAFRDDSIEPVKDGTRGADVLQRVRSPRGMDCGAVLWESKNAKNWNPAWIEKLRADQQAAKADLAVVVTRALPEGLGRISFNNGVWICDFASVVVLAMALRFALLRIAHARAVDVNRSQVESQVYDYVCSQAFANRLINLVVSTKQMQDDLDAEKRSAARQFAPVARRRVDFLPRARPRHRTSPPRHCETRRLQTRARQRPRPPSLQHPPPRPRSTAARKPRPKCTGRAALDLGDRRRRALSPPAAN